MTLHVPLLIAGRHNNAMQQIKYISIQKYLPYLLVLFFVVIGIGGVPKQASAWGENICCSSNSVINLSGTPRTTSVSQAISNALVGAPVGTGGSNNNNGGGGGVAAVTLTAAQRTQAILQATAITSEQIRSMTGAQIDALTGIDRVAAEIARAKYVPVDGHYRTVTYNADGSITIEACTNGRGLSVNIITPAITYYPDNDCTGSCGSNPPPVIDYSPQGDVWFLGDGYHDSGVNENTICEVVRGWSCDRNAPRQPLTIDVKIDDVTRTSILSDTPTPALERSENNWWYLPMCGEHTPDDLHGYRYVIPAALKDGNTHKLELLMHNIGPKGSELNALLVNASMWTPNPKTFHFNCPFVGDIVDLKGEMPPVSDRFKGEIYTIDSVEVKNIGTLPTNGSFRVQLEFDYVIPGFEADGSMTNKFDVSGADGDFYSEFITVSDILAPGESKLFQFDKKNDGSLLSHDKIGNWRVRVSVDPQGNVEPKDGPQRSDNISAWRSFDVIKPPALACTLRVSPETVHEGEETTLTWDITRGIAVSGKINDVSVSDVNAGSVGVVKKSTIELGIEPYTLVVKNEDEEEGVCTADLQVVPVGGTVFVDIDARSLVRYGDQTPITWKVTGLIVSSCTVSGFDTPVNFTTSGLSNYSNSMDSGPIEGKRTFTINCGGVIDSVIVKPIGAATET